jgi:hypothetical protein
MIRLNRSCDPQSLRSKLAVAASIVALASLPISAQGQQASTSETIEHSSSSERTFTVKLNPPKQKQYCKASTTTEYYQSDDVAEVNVGIKNEDCAASSGSFTIRVRYRTEEDEVVNLEFDETWQREDDQDILFSRQYPIGKNVDLMRVRPARMRCVCTENEDELENENQQ